MPGAVTLSLPVLLAAAFVYEHLLAHSEDQELRAETCNLTCWADTSDHKQDSAVPPAEACRASAEGVHIPTEKASSLEGNKCEAACCLALQE